MEKIKLIKNEFDLWPKNKHQSFYDELTSRNFHFVSHDTQLKLKELKIAIAGCGSTGGACIEALARVGVENFYLADNGEYDISNLNRQHFKLDNVGENKAEFHRIELLKINPYIQCEIFNKGVQKENVDRICEWADFIIDAVDVTTKSGMESKIELHKCAKRNQKPIASALDLGFRQWGMSFDYRKKNLDVFAGKLNEIQKCQHPIKALFSIYPIESIPSHAFELIFDLLENKREFASQIGCTSDLLSGIIVPVIIRFTKDGFLTKGWSIDQSEIVMSNKEKLKYLTTYYPNKIKLKKILKAMP